MIIIMPILLFFFALVNWGNPVFSPPMDGLEDLESATNVELL